MVVFAGCFFNYLEEKVVGPRNPIFYARYLDNTCQKEDEFYNNLNSFHNNIRLTIKKNFSKFLDTQIFRIIDGTLSFKVVPKTIKLPPHWYRRSLSYIKEHKGNLFRACRSGSNFKHELEVFK